MYTCRVINQFIIMKALTSFISQKATSEVYDTLAYRHFRAHGIKQKSFGKPYCFHKAGLNINFYTNDYKSWWTIVNGKRKYLHTYDNLLAFLKVVTPHYLDTLDINQKILPLKKQQRREKKQE